jgi:hypothetical protein
MADGIFTRWSNTKKVKIQMRDSVQVHSRQKVKFPENGIDPKKGGIKGSVRCGAGNGCVIKPGGTDHDPCKGTYAGDSGSLYIYK